MNDIPWPVLDEHEEKIEVPLREDYKFEDMWYLDTPEAYPIFEVQADIIIKHQSKGIVDIGCRHGPVLKILHDKGYTDFNYMGFDTSEEPINIARHAWNNFNNIEFRCGSWEDKNIFNVDFNVDQVIWSGVLIYRPDDHFKFFNSITKELYNSKNAIIQEPYHEQRYTDPRLVLHTITNEMQEYKNTYQIYNDQIVDCEIFLGKRLVVDITV